MKLQLRLARTGLCLVWSVAACAPAWGNPAATTPSDRPRLQLEQLHHMASDGRPTLQLLLSPDEQRVARLSPQNIELWQLQPLQSLAKILTQKKIGEPPLGWRTGRMTFDSSGRLHFISTGLYMWLNPDLTQGEGDSDVRVISPDGRYALRYSTVGDKPGQIPPTFYGAQDDIYDLQQQRSRCQLPGTATANPGSFGGHFFAAQLRAMGPSIPRPVVICDMNSGQVVTISRDKRVSMGTFIDPQGRFLQLTISGTNFFAGNWVERQLHALPLQTAEFVIGKEGGSFECREIACGNPPPLDFPEQSIPWTRDISRDSRWWVTLASKPLRAEFFRMEGLTAQKMAVLNYTPSGVVPAPPRGPEHRVVFSRNNRWVALQFEQKLYLVDLNAEKLEPTEVSVNTPAPFELQDIDNTGTRWLLRDPDRVHANGPVSGLWQLKR